MIVALPPLPVTALPVRRPPEPVLPPVATLPPRFEAPPCWLAMPPVPKLPPADVAKLALSLVETMCPPSPQPRVVNISTLTKATRMISLGFRVANPRPRAEESSTIECGQCCHPKHLIQQYLDRHVVANVLKSPPRACEYLSAALQCDAVLTHPSLLRAVSDLVCSVVREEVSPKFQRLSASDVRNKWTQDDPEDVVTSVDEAVESRLMPALLALVPGSVTIGEEAAGRTPALLDLLGGSDPVWVIDPLDGTKNFVAGRPTFGTMVALIVNGQTELSVIYLPENDALHAVARGVPYSMAEVPPTTADHRHRGMLHTHYLEASLANRLGTLALSCTLLTPSGSAAVTYAALVTNQLDFAFYGRLLPWDHAPGVFLLQQHGGVARFLGGKNYEPTVTRGPLLVARTEAIWNTIEQSIRWLHS